MWRSFGVFIVNFEHVIAGWVTRGRGAGEAKQQINGEQHQTKTKASVWDRLK